MVRTCMNTFKVTSIAYTGTDPKGFASTTGPAPGTYVPYLDLFHITRTHHIIKTICVTVGKLICESGG